MTIARYSSESPVTLPIPFFYQGMSTVHRPSHDDACTTDLVKVAAIWFRGLWSTASASCRESENTLKEKNSVTLYLFVPSQICTLLRGVAIGNKQLDTHRSKPFATASAGLVCLHTLAGEAPGLTELLTRACQWGFSINKNTLTDDAYQRRKRRCI